MDDGFEGGSNDGNCNSENKLSEHNCMICTKEKSNNDNKVLSTISISKVCWTWVFSFYQDKDPHTIPQSIC